MPIQLPSDTSALKIPSLIAEKSEDLVTLPSDFPVQSRPVTRGSEAVSPDTLPDAIVSQAPDEPL